MKVLPSLIPKLIHDISWKKNLHFKKHSGEYLAYYQSADWFKDGKRYKSMPLYITRKSGWSMWCHSFEYEVDMFAAINKAGPPPYDEK